MREPHITPTGHPMPEEAVPMTEGEAPKKDVSKLQDDPVARGIAVGTALLGAYMLDKVLGEDWYEVDDKGNVTHKEKGLLQELME